MTDQLNWYQKCKVITIDKIASDYWRQQQIKSVDEKDIFFLVWSIINPVQALNTIEKQLYSATFESVAMC